MWSGDAEAVDRFACSLQDMIERTVRSIEGFPFDGTPIVEVESSFAVETGIGTCIFRLPRELPTANVKRVPLTLRLWICPGPLEARALYAALHGQQWVETGGEWKSTLSESRYEHGALDGLPKGNSYLYRHNYIYNKVPVEGDGNDADDRIGFVYGNVVADAGTHSYRASRWTGDTIWLKAGFTWPIAGFDEGDRRDEREVRSLLRPILAHLQGKQRDEN